MCRRLVKPFVLLLAIPIAPVSGARERRDHACPAAPAGPGRHPGHPVAVEGLPAQRAEADNRVERRTRTRQALTIVTVPVSLGAVRGAVKKAYARSHHVVIPAGAR